ncbi:MAG: hypothetical protein M1827_006459 [Pycnora praestabilis]|nr:MAG: hypothetical protein M1827_006459 [Pycnora praestabilis]
MPPTTRRLKVFGLFIVVVVILTLYLTSGARQARSQDFYSKTVNAMEAKDAENLDVSQRLKSAENAAKNAADSKSPKPGIVLKGEKMLAEDEKSVAGRKKMKTGVEETPAVAQEKSKEDHDVEVELNDILKRSPIIIFSKSYCPYSKKAKIILLEKYKIVPAPWVVELDEHPLGHELQTALKKSTGRATVPNVLINGKSIGGGDDVEELQNSGTLIDKVKKMGGKRIMEVGLREIKEEE